MQNTQRPQDRRLRLLVTRLALLLASTAPFPRTADAALVTGNYQLNWDQSVEKTSTGTTDTRALKQTLELKQKGFLSPVVANEVKFKIEQEVKNNAPDVIRLYPSVDLGFNGRYWDTRAGARRTIEESDEVGIAPRTSDSYYVEFSYKAPKRVPDFKGKYTLDKDQQGGTTDTVKEGVTLSSVYSPNDWLGLKGEYSRNTSQDLLKADLDTEEEKFSGTVGVRRILNRKIRASSEYRMESNRSATLLTGGGAKEQKEDQGHQFRNTLSYRMFRDTSMDGGYDLNLRQNMVNGRHDLTTTARAGLSQKIGDPLDFKGEYTRTITKARHTVERDDSQIAEDNWTADLKAKFSKQLDFSFRYQKRETIEDHTVDSADKSSGTTVGGASWQGELGTWWRPAASFERTDTFDNNSVKSRTESKYSVKSTFDLRGMNFILDPSYDVTVSTTFVPSPTRKEDSRDFKVKISYLAFRTRTLEGKIDHSYGRIEKKTFDPADATAPETRTVTRTDSTQANVAWNAPLRGWKFSFDASRQASDSSGDPEPPDVSASFGGKADLSYDPISFSTGFKYDRKKVGDDSESFDAKMGWVAPKWDFTLTYSFKKTFSANLSEGYTISLTFKYNL